MQVSRLSIALVLGLVAACGEPESRPNLLVISIDTLRADHLGVYGYERPTSPNLDQLAARSVVFDPVIADSSWTIPSHVTMLSGLSSRSHGVVNPMLEVPDETVLLAEVLRDANYNTFAITDGGWLSPKWGFDQGFVSFDAQDRQTFGPIVQRAQERIRHAASRGESWFGFLQTYDTHCPYNAPPNYRALFRSPGAIEFPTEGQCGNPTFNSLVLQPGHEQHLVDLYDAGVRWVDDVLGELISWLDAEGHTDNLVLVITSDHGEELFEQGRIGHGTTLDREVLEVPWILVAPGIEPRIIDGPAALADITPTVLELLGIDATSPMDGRSWVPALRGEPMPQAGAYASVAWEASLESWTTRDAHFVRPLADASDPANSSTSGMSSTSSNAPPELLEHLNRAPTQSLPTTRRPNLSDAELTRLRALGYLGD